MLPSAKEMVLPTSSTVVVYLSVEDKLNPDRRLFLNCSLKQSLTATSSYSDIVLVYGGQTKSWQKCGFKL